MEVLKQKIEKLEKITNELKQLTLIGSKNVLSVKELSLFTGLSVQTIYNLVSQKKIPYYKNEGGKLTFFKKVEIEKWLCAVPFFSNEAMEQNAVFHCFNNKKGGVL